MIKRLNNKNKATAIEIQALFQASYQIEAQILNAKDFPPLKRKLIDYIITDTEFYGVYKESKIQAIIEIQFYEETNNINSLVVHPDYFRQGLGKQLMLFAINTYNPKTLTVETGLLNEPAIRLYKNLGFREIKQWDTEVGIRKIKFEKF